MRRWLAVLLWLPALAAAEDLLEVWAQARAADPVLAAAQAQRGAQEELAVQARSSLLPQWSIALDNTRLHPQDTTSRSATSSIGQTLFDLSSLRNWDAARTDLSAQEARLRAAEQDLCARVAAAYFGVLLAQANVATAQANEVAYATQVQQAEARFAARLSAAVDVEQGRTYLELARGGTVQARQALADAREALAQITGRTPGELKPLAAALPAQPLAPADPQAWVARALAANPALQAEAQGVDASEQRIAAARAAHWPTLALGLDSARNGGSAADPAAPRTTNQLALRLTLPLFAGGTTQSKVRQAAYERDARRETQEAARRSLIRETQAQFQAVTAGLVLMQSGGAAVAAADRALASTRTGIALGTRTMTDLLLAIQTQAAAQNAYEQARHGWVLATLLLQQAAGSLGEPELAAVNRLLQEQP